MRGETRLWGGALQCVLRPDQKVMEWVTAHGIERIEHRVGSTYRVVLNNPWPPGLAVETCVLEPTGARLSIVGVEHRSFDIHLTGPDGHVCDVALVDVFLRVQTTDGYSPEQFDAYGLGFERGRMEGLRQGTAFAKRLAGER